MVMIGAFAIYVTHIRMGLPIWLALPLALVICMIIGLIIEKTAFSPLIDAIQQHRLIATIAYAVLFLVLIFMPNGLMGEKETRKV